MFVVHLTVPELAKRVCTAMQRNLHALFGVASIS